ncbi:MAG: transposase [Chloroflexi bacterium]|nr:transposase [Chloroflexota bacterium]
MAYTNVRTLRQESPLPPVVQEIKAVLAELSQCDEELLEALRGPRRRGPHGYDPEILWHCFVAYYLLGRPSVSDLIRLLHDNPYVAKACGIDSPESIPSQPTFSRFFTKLSKRLMRGQVNQVFHKLTRKCYRTLPAFGDSVAMDATDIKAWSNGAHLKPTDKDAGWIIKNATNGRGKFTWGYKVSLLVDTTHELPLAVHVMSGNKHETKAASTLLSQARWINSKFHPEYVIADAGYCSEAVRHLIRRQYRAVPIIKTNPSHKRAVRAYPEDADWQDIYDRRTSVERVFSRLKANRKLNSVRVRGINKVKVHCLLSVIAFQACALATNRRACVRRVVGQKWPTKQLTKQRIAAY